MSLDLPTIDDIQPLIDDFKDSHFINPVSYIDMLNRQGSHTAENSAYVAAFIIYSIHGFIPAEDYVVTDPVMFFGPILECIYNTFDNPADRSKKQDNLVNLLEGLAKETEDIPDYFQDWISILKNKELSFNRTKFVQAFLEFYHLLIHKYSKIPADAVYIIVQAAFLRIRDS